jgi:hypothetical protein
MVIFSGFSGERKDCCKKVLLLPEILAASIPGKKISPRITGMRKYAQF